ncbi:MAG: ribbon-helix-helix protein, CopG family [Candidatus Gastranaerophilales bacterium]|nr:ribbon-helix-helix protein, CopG family [Candidatus Gastranaerophilales bacterium]
MAKVLVSMKDTFLKTIDEIARQEQRSRSELIREALRTYLKRAQNVSPEKANKNAVILEGLLD